MWGNGWRAALRKAVDSQCVKTRQTGWLHYSWQGQELGKSQSAANGFPRDGRAQHHLRMHRLTFWSGSGPLWRAPCL